MHLGYFLLFLVFDWQQLSQFQQQMDLADLLDIGRGDRVQVTNPQRRRDDAGGGARHAIGDELEVIRRMFAGQALVHLFADVLAQDIAGEGLTLIEEAVVGMQGPEMHQFQGKLVVVLQGVDQRAGVDALAVHFPQHQAQKFGIAHQQRVLVGRAGDEVIGQVGAALGHGCDVIHGEVQLLETEATGLANRAAEQLVAGDR